MKKRVTDHEWHIMHFLRGRRWSTAEIGDTLKRDPSVVRYQLAKPQQPSQKQCSPRQTKKAIVDRRKLVIRLVDTVVQHKRQAFTPIRGKSKVRVIIRRPFQSPARISRELLLQYGIRASLSTVRRDLLSLGRKAYRRRRVPVLSAAQINNRVQFCVNILHRQPKLIFTDEKWLSINDMGDQWQWCSSIDEVIGRSQEQGAERILLWGAVGLGVKRLMVIDASSLTKDSYKKLVLDPSLKWLKSLKGMEFMQDNARPHCGGLDHLRSKGVACMKESWPAASCDLNIIETVWSLLQYRVSREGPYGKKELMEFARKAWDEISQETIDKLCDGFWDRCRDCIAQKGHTIKPKSHPRQEG